MVYPKKIVKNLKHELKSLGLLTVNKCKLLRNKQLDQLLNQSLGKLNDTEIFSRQNTKH